MNLELTQEMEKEVGALDFNALTQMETQNDGLSDWHKERLGKFTSSRIGDLMTKGRVATAALEKKLSKLDPDSDEHKELKQEIEAKKYAALFGESAKTYIREKLAELLTGLPKETPETFAMAWGTKYEPEAIQFYAENFAEEEVKHLGTVFVKFSELCGGSPDGYVGEDGIIEVKCPNSHNHLETLMEDHIKMAYIYQCQANMLFTGRKWCDFISYDPRFQDDSLKMKVIRVNKDESICNAILDRIGIAADMVLEYKEKYNLDFKLDF